MILLGIVEGEDIDHAHLEKSGGVTVRQVTPSQPIAPPQTKQTLTGALKQLNPERREGTMASVFCWWTLYST